MRICGSSLPEPQLTRFSDEEGYLMIVADGMGGVAGGEEASAMAVRSVESFVLDAIKWFLHRDGSEQNVLVSELKQALERADRSVVEQAEADPKLYGMGTTLTMAYSVGTDLFVAHAGDSRAYLIPPREARADHVRPHAGPDAGRLRRHQPRRCTGAPAPAHRHERPRRPEPRRRRRDQAQGDHRRRPALALHRRPDRSPR